MTAKLFNVDKRQQLVLIVLAAVIIFFTGYKFSSWQQSGQEQDLLTIASQQDQDERLIAVHISGAVEKPGLYKVPIGSRVQDAVDKAVPLPEADIQGLNLAASLKDGQKLVIPLEQDYPNSNDLVGEEISQGATVVASSKVTGSSNKVNINRANAEELEKLPGIGPTLVQRIINYRETQGMFTSEEDIKSVQGIGDKTYEKIKDRITVN